MGSCIRFGAVSGDWGYRDRRIGKRERECVCVVVLSGGELDGGRRATMWVSPQYIIINKYILKDTQDRSS